MKRTFPHTSKLLKKATRGLLWCTAGLIALFLLLAVAVYLPPVQRMAVRMATASLREQTGLDVRIGYVRLAFPLDLALHKVEVNTGGKPMLRVRSVLASVRMLPLLREQVLIDGFQLNEADVNTRSFLSDLRVEGSIPSLSLRADCIDLSSDNICLNDLCLRGAKLSVFLSDTAKKDTTPSQTKWVVNMRRAQVKDSRIFLSMPGDSMRISAGIDRLTARGGLFDLGAGDYTLRRLRLSCRNVNYDLPYEKRQAGLDPSHIHLDKVRGGVNNISFSGGSFAATLPYLSLHEESGLCLRDLHATLAIKPTGVYVPRLGLQLLHSRLDLALLCDSGNLKQLKNDTLLLRLKASIDRRDLTPFAYDNDLRELLASLPSNTLRGGITASGNLKRVTLRRALVEIPSVATLSAKGRILKPFDKDRNGNISFRLHTGNLNPVKRLLALDDGPIVLPQKMNADGMVSFGREHYKASINAHAAGGTLELNGSYGTQRGDYTLSTALRALPLQAFLPSLPIKSVTATLQAKGCGFDPFSPRTRLNTKIALQQLIYDSLRLDSLALEAELREGQGLFRFTSRNVLLDGEGEARLSLENKSLTAELNSRLKKVNLAPFVGGDDTLALRGDIHLEGHTDKDYSNFGLRGGVSDIHLLVRGEEYTTKDLSFACATRRDTLFANLKAGDLDAGIAAKGSLASLEKKLSDLIALFEKTNFAEQPEHDVVRKSLPEMGIRLLSGSDNPVANYLKYVTGYDFQSLSLRLITGPEQGIQGKGFLTGFNTGKILLDSTALRLFDDSIGLKMEAGVYNTQRDNPHHFIATLQGFLENERAGVELRFLDEDGKDGLHLGIASQREENGYRLHLFPHDPIIAYRQFRVNDSNYIFLGKDQTILADLDLLADDGTGLRLYSSERDEGSSLTASISRLNLAELTASLPYLPRLSGHLTGDVQIERAERLSAAGDLQVDNLSFEGTELGNMGMEFSYLPDETLTRHFVSGSINRDRKEVALVDGSYNGEGEGSLDLQLTLTKFPLAMINGFMGGILGLSGEAGGTLTVKGPTDSPQISGEITPDSMRVSSEVYGVNLLAENKPIYLKNSRLDLDRVKFFSTGKNPLEVAGSVDFSRFDNIRIDLNLSAKNFEIINAEKTNRSEVYGKVWADFSSSVKGNTSHLKVRGNVAVSGNSEIGYVLRDSPLSVDERLGDLVTFISFSDTLQSPQKELPPVMGIDMVLALSINDAAQLHCDLSEDGQSYLDVEGGGEMTMKYTPDGEIIMVGRYTMGKGEMKYTLPVIPLKTFQIVEGSYVEFMGEPMNPTLSIRAKERVRASVNEDNNPRSVAFDVGVSITKQLSDMGLEFIIEAPEDGTVQNQLASLSPEERGKLAISMLVTGMYLSENNTASGFTASNALNAFLQNEIQQIAGNAMKTIDLSVSVDNSMSESGEGGTDYSFRFAKRFWGNRIRFIIGGSVSTGNDAQNSAGSFIDNVSLEYRLDKTASRHIHLYYNNEANDPLEGQLSELGGGLVLRRKASTFGELFILRKKKEGKTAPNP